MKLTREQQRIAETDHPRVEVPACPGSGKTRVLQARARHLIRNGQDPNRILVLSFSNAAVDEIKHRLARVHRGNRIHVQTCHAFALSIVTANYRLLGRKSKPRFRTDADTAPLLTKARTAVVAELSRERRSSTGDLKRMLSSEIAWLHRQSVRSAPRDLMPLAVHVATSLSPVADLSRAPAWRWTAGHDEVLEAVLHRFRKLKREANVVDFSDCVRLAAKLAADPRVIGIDFDHVLVDEYQDTSPAQARLLRRLAQRVPNIMVVGDPNQAVFAFAGAAYTPLADLLPDVKVLRLTQSFRLNQAHADFANSLLAANLPRSTKLTPFSGHPRSNRPVLVLARSIDEQAEENARRALGLLSDGEPPSSIAVLARTREQLSPIRRALSAFGVNAGGTHGSSLVHVRRVLKLVAAVGKPDLNDAVLAVVPDEAPVGRQDRVVARCRRAERSATLEGRFKECAAAYMVARGGVRADLPLRKLLAEWGPLCRKFRGVLAMRKHVRRLIGEPIHTGTIHGAKGHEWPHVFVVGVTDGVIPDYRATTAANRQQELQTLFVAVTRASSQLTLLSAPQTIITAGRKRIDATKVSRFLEHATVRATIDVYGNGQFVRQCAASLRGRANR